MNRKQFKQWLKRLYVTSEREMSCEQFQASMPALVDVEIAGGDWREQFSAALAHMRQCSDCAAEYEALREVARLERQGRLPTVDESLQKFENVPEVEQRELA